MNEKILTAIKDVRKSSKKRKFTQTFDLIVNLKHFDVKKPENRINEGVVLPNGKGEVTEVVVFSDKIKDVDVKVLSGKDIKEIVKDKRRMKKLVKGTDFFLAEPRLMPTIGKKLGESLGPMGKMPAVIRGDVKEMIKRYKRSVRIRVRDSPVVQCPVGDEEMEDEKVAENILTVMKFLKKRLPRGEYNVDNVLLKLTMGKPVEIEV